MIDTILGKKLEMTIRFDKNGKVLPATLILAGPCIIAAKRTNDKDGYNAAIIGYLKAKKTSKSKTGQFKNLPFIPGQLKEVKIDNLEDLNIGDEIGVDIFEAGAHSGLSPDFHVFRNEILTVVLASRCRPLPGFFQTDVRCSMRKISTVSLLESFSDRNFREPSSESFTFRVFRRTFLNFDLSRLRLLLLPRNSDVLVVVVIRVWKQVLTWISETWKVICVAFFMFTVSRDM
jgi:hypothetical protein